jgi:hypothetical protein
VQKSNPFRYTVESQSKAKGETKMNRGLGMTRKIYLHIKNNLHQLKLDLMKGKILNRNSTALDRYGYLRVGLEGKTVYQHQILAVARWGEKCIGQTVDHINEIKTDNSWDNLQLISLAQNTSNKSKKGFGQKKPVKAIDLETGKETRFESLSEASRELGLRVDSICYVLKGCYKRTGKYTFERIGL